MNNCKGIVPCSLPVPSACTTKQWKCAPFQKQHSNEMFQCRFEYNIQPCPISTDAGVHNVVASTRHKLHETVSMEFTTTQRTTIYIKQSIKTRLWFNAIYTLWSKAILMIENSHSAMDACMLAHNRRNLLPPQTNYWYASFQRAHFP